MAQWTSDSSRSYNYRIHYEAFHKDTDEHFAGMAEYYAEQLQPFLPDPHGCPVLDIGCGWGFALAALRNLGFANLLGIDIDKEQVRHCQRRGLPVQHIDDTGAFLEQRPQEFDFILLLDVLEHIRPEEQIAFMRAVYSALRPGGRVILRTPNANCILASRIRYIDYTHHCSFTEYSLKFVLWNAGFRNIILPGQGKLSRPPLSLWKRSTRLAFRKWVVRFMWRQVLASMIGSHANLDDIPVEFDILCAAFRDK